MSINRRDFLKAAAISPLLTPQTPEKAIEEPSRPELSAGAAHEQIPLGTFCKEFMPESFSLPFLEWHRSVIRDFGEAENQDGSFRYYSQRYGERGIGKSTIAIAAALHALLERKKRFILHLSATESSSAHHLRHFGGELASNPHFQVHYPENVLWTAEDNRKFYGRGILPCGDSFILFQGIHQSLKGLTQRLPTGERIRPDMVIIDDPYCPESLHSPAFGLRVDRQIKLASNIGAPNKSASVVVLV